MQSAGILRSDVQIHTSRLQAGVSEGLLNQWQWRLSFNAVAGVGVTEPMRRNVGNADSLTSFLDYFPNPVGLEVVLALLLALAAEHEVVR